MYDHSNKVGNRGDLIKHFALTTAVRRMATEQESFSYLDVHSGRSRYELPPSGTWKTGIGSFSEHCQNDRVLTEDLRYFCKVHSIADVSNNRKYFGSSQIIMNVLHDLRVNRRKVILCDTNPEVCKDLEKSFQEVSSVQICPTDGYRKAHDAETMDLIFIDPPDIKEHYPPFLKLVRHCISHGKNFISWNPLNGDTTRNTMSQKCRSIAELAEKEQIPAITVRWTRGWSGQMCGCQMLFSIPHGNKTVDACGTLINLMDWRMIHTHSPLINNNSSGL